MITYECKECKIYALGIEVEPHEAICLCGNEMVVFKE